MRLMQRLSRGAEAGLIAGGAVALVFFVSDLVHLTPLATPAALANALMADPPASADLPMAAGVMGGVVLAAGLLVYSTFHFAAFAMLGMVAAFILPGRSWTHMLGGGALYGVVACTAVFFGTRLVVGSPFTVDNLSFSTLVLTNAAAGLAIGLVLYVHEAADRQVEAEPA